MKAKTVRITYGPLPPGIPANLTGCNVEHPAVAVLTTCAASWHDRCFGKYTSDVVPPGRILNQCKAAWDATGSSGVHESMEGGYHSAASLLASNRIAPGDL